MCIVSVIQGLGVVCNKETGFTEDDFVVEFLGEVKIPFNYKGIYVFFRIFKYMFITLFFLGVSCMEMV